MQASSNRPFVHASCAAVALLLSLVLACRAQPVTDEPWLALNLDAVDENPDLAEDDGALTALAATLDGLFGPQHEPRYYVPSEWGREGFDPNRGRERLTQDELEELRADNRVRFAAQLAAIDRGALGELRVPGSASELSKPWRTHLDARPEASDEEARALWLAQARGLFEGYYPSLANSARFFQARCSPCHGRLGGGDGPLAARLDPRPRDYRHGKFKFTALRHKARPRHADLVRTLNEGIYTTAMPSFRRFSRARLHGMADYVQLLSIRGETELLLVQDFETGDVLDVESALENYAFVFDKWRRAGEQLIAWDGPVPSATPEAIARGRDHFLNESGPHCARCHGKEGRGDGESAWVRVVDPVTGEAHAELARDDWGNPIRPRDLTSGKFRFGDQPIDQFRRVWAGINGTPMPAHHGMRISTPDGETRELSDQDIWDIVHYVRSLSGNAD